MLLNRCSTGLQVQGCAASAATTARAHDSLEPGGWGWGARGRCSQCRICPVQIVHLQGLIRADFCKLKVDLLGGAAFHSVSAAAESKAQEQHDGFGANKGGRPGAALQVHATHSLLLSCSCCPPMLTERLEDAEADGHQKSHYRSSYLQYSDFSHFLAAIIVRASTLLVGTPGTGKGWSNLCRRQLISYGGRAAPVRTPSQNEEFELDQVLRDARAVYAGLGGFLLRALVTDRRTPLPLADAWQRLVASGHTLRAVHFATLDAQLLLSLADFELILTLWHHLEDVDITSRAGQQGAQEWVAARFVNFWQSAAGARALDSATLQRFRHGWEKAVPKQKQRLAPAQACGLRMDS